jgi:hypothetical protein
MTVAVSHGRQVIRANEGPQFVDAPFCRWLLIVLSGRFFRHSTTQVTWIYLASNLARYSLQDASVGNNVVALADSVPCG